MKYIDLVKEAKEHGRWNEKAMWASVEHISDMLEKIKDERKELYWSFMRNQYGIMSGGHYDKVWADWDVSQMYSTNKEGKKWQGAYWSVEQIEAATKDKSFPSGTTKWDKFVSYNSAKHDFCKSFDDENILKIAYDFYFTDEDFGKDRGSKIWNYMAMVHDKD